MCCASMRAEVSLMPPGGHGTTRRIGRVGNACPELVEAAWGAAAPTSVAGGSANMIPTAMAAAADNRMRLLRLFRARARRLDHFRPPDDLGLDELRVLG